MMLSIYYTVLYCVCTAGTEVHAAVFSQYPRKPKDDDIPWQDNGIDHQEPSDFEYMGYSVRVDGWRYTEWYHWNQVIQHTHRHTRRAPPCSHSLTHYLSNL